MPLAEWLAPTLQASSTILSAGSQVARGRAAQLVAARRKAADDFEARQQDTAASDSSAVGMRAAQDDILKASLINSSALAKAAASGAGASDPTVMAVLARTAGEGAYRSAVNMYEGEAQARLDRMRASALRYQGDIGVADAELAAKQANVGAASTLLTGGIKALSLYDKFWSGPKATQTTTLPDVSFQTSRASGSWLDAGTSIDQAAA